MRKPRKHEVEVPEASTEVVEMTAPTPPVGSYLERVRTEALEQTQRLARQGREVEHDVARTIADLEAWAAEIQATIAFLRATRR